MKIEGCVALVTGASRGLGRALVRALVEAGAQRVWAGARDVEAVRVEDPRVVPLPLDTTDRASVIRAAEAAADVRLLINNAGAATSRDVLGWDTSALEHDLRTNLFGTLAVVRAFLPTLERAPADATIVNVLSLASLAGLPPMAGYAASKAAAYSVTQALRPELRRRGIALLAALPGPIDTDMVRDLTMPKAAPGDVARALVAGIERAEEEIFPDATARELGALFQRNPKDFERALGSF